MNDKVVIIDESIKLEILRYPMVDLIQSLFPGHKVRRGVMCSPFRQDKNPSFSCFRGKNGVSLGKDHSTGITYDNIMLYRAVFPEYDYVESVDRLSRLVLGRPAVLDHASSSLPRARKVVPQVKEMEKEKESVLKVVRELSVLDPSVPVSVRNYWRGRGISDSIASQFCKYYELENSNRKGRPLFDKESGLPLVDQDGKSLVDDGIIQGIGHRNDIGGVVFRSPDTVDSKGFKGATSSFISTILADGSRPEPKVSFFGKGDNYFHYLRYEPSENAVYINKTQGFKGVTDISLPYAMTFLGCFSGSLDERETKCACAVLSSLEAPVAADVVFVEGMFDGLSDREMNVGMGKRGYYDLVILNSISNIRWAVPFLARHNKVVSMMDNDLNSGAGKKAFDLISSELKAFSSALGKATLIYDGSSLFEGYKDLNDALMAMKGFPVKKESASKEKVQTLGKRR